MGTIAVQSESGVRSRRVQAARRQGVPILLIALMLVSLLATGISVASYFLLGAVVSALFAAFFYGLLVAFKLTQRSAWVRTMTGIAAPPDAPAETVDPEDDLEEIAPEVAQEIVVAERAGFRMGLVIAAPLAGLALVLAAVFVGWKALGLGALAFFAMLIFMGAPIWLAAIEDTIDADEEKIGVDTRSIR